MCVREREKQSERQLKHKQGETESSVCLRVCKRGKQLTWCQLGAHIVSFPGGEAHSETLNHFIHFKLILLFSPHAACV